MKNTSTNFDKEGIKLKTFWIVLGILLIAVILAACSTQEANGEYLEDPTVFFPPLNDPPGASRPGGGGGGNSDKRGMKFDLVTDLPIEEVHQYYASQLEAAGWTYISEDFEVGLFISYWDGYKDGGQIWPAILEITTEPVNPQANYTIELRAVLPP